MTRDEKISILRGCIEAAESLNGLTSESPQFIKWQRDTEIAIGRIFGSELQSRHLPDFGQVIFYSTTTIPFNAARRGINRTALEQRALTKGVHQARAVLESMIDELLSYETPTTGKFGVQDATSFSAKVQTAAKTCTCVSALFLDLDNFKSVNDNYDHPTGDTVIRQALQLIEATVKGKGELFHRSGDEILVLLPNFDHSEAASVAERIRQAIQTYDFPVVGHGSITATIGVATYPETTPNWEHLELEADRVAMQAKKLGKNRVARQSETPKPEVNSLDWGPEFKRINETLRRPSKWKI